MDSLQTWALWLEQNIPAGFWRDKVYAYCERGTSSAFWAEPLNAWSNGAFHLAAILAFLIWAVGSQRRVVDLALILLVFVIGTGSFLFHTLATRWAAVADTAPIGIFMVSFLAYAVKRWMGAGWIVTIGALAAFFVMLWQSSVVRCDGEPCLNGSVAYFPALAALLVIGLYLMVRGHKAGKYLFFAGVIFAASLTFRSIDRSICPQTIISIIDASRPSGTHFIWHILNATLLFLLLIAALRHGGRRIA
ncbi:MAG: ceramidase domain-containing protein [Pseudomonadota bacterium]